MRAAGRLGGVPEGVWPALESGALALNSSLNSPGSTDASLLAASQGRRAIGHLRLITPVPGTSFLSIRAGHAARAPSSPSPEYPASFLLTGSSRVNPPHPDCFPPRRATLGGTPLPASLCKVELLGACVADALTPLGLDYVFSAIFSGDPETIEE
ncbi:hypothetical protein EVG20_g5295 [Dentipellis fragilis]|uniref:Uncharacterized protein n=1 Tax=Dentipellis fragilis TaxID=205917 RepID=A0A4Y9YVP5_9AGAM|nr:hypothetical protein EVG20_g5295 [Dentipellis fragilis]